jgi:hypothetical protein
MPVKEKKDQGAEFFESRFAAKKTGPGNPTWPTGSTTVRRNLYAPGGVLYAPYSIDEWRKKIANSQDATTVLIGTKSSNGSGRKNGEKQRFTQFESYTQTLYDTFGGETWRIASGSGELLSLVADLPKTANDTMPKALALAGERFLSDYYKTKSSIAGASSLAEMASTVRGLASPAKALRGEVSNLYQSLKKRAYRSDGRATKDAAKAIAGTWLEWQFGIKPLVSDANAAALACNKLSEGDFRATMPLRGTGIDSLMTEKFGPVAAGAVTINGINIGGQFAYYTWEEHETLCIVRGAVRVAPDGGEVPPAMQFGVGFEDILPAVWEAIPWSFFYDYFFNISSVIESWGNLQQRLSWCNRTVRNSRSLILSDVVPLGKSGTGLAKSDVYTASGGHGRASYTSTARSPVFWGDIAPTLRITLPGFGTKWANMAALSQMFTPPGKQPEWVGRKYGTRRRTRADLWDWVTKR